MRIILAGIVGGLVLFIWSAISWMLLPWHIGTLNHFKEEKVVSETIMTNTVTSGIYIAPFMEQSDATVQNSPMVFAAIQRSGMDPNMTPALIKGVIIQILAACLVSWLLFQTIGLGYWLRVFFVVVFAFAAALVTHVPYWNWFGFDVNFTIVQILDLLIGWFLAGLAISKFYPRKRLVRT